MTFEFYILNIIQAVAEFLPISSSGHLIIANYFYGIAEEGFEAFLHLPTALAIGIVFWRAYIDLLKERKLWLPFLMVIIPAGTIGLLFGDMIDDIFYSPLIVGINQIFWGGVLLWTGTRTPEQLKTTINSWKDLSWLQALKIGLMQILALIPGTSRSGITTLSGIWTGLAPKESAAFSFIAGFPLIAAASGVGLLKLIIAEEFIVSIDAITLISGMILSLVLGIIFMKLFTSRHTLTVMKYSGLYRIILGSLLLLWLL